MAIRPSDIAFSGQSFQGRDTVRIVQTLYAAEGPADSVVVADDLLTHGTLNPLLEKAITHWTAAEVDLHRLDVLAQVDVQITDLSGSLLGMASANTIWIDHDAAGYGWGTGSGEVDLLSVITHELGHVLGFDHTAMGVDDTLAVGTRRIPQPLPLAGDADDNGEVDFGDFLKLAANFGSTEAVWEDGDFNGDEAVNFFDFLILSANYGESRQPVVAPTLSQTSEAAETLPASNISAADDLFKRFDDELSLDDLL